jgi:hypothetical protein
MTQPYVRELREVVESSTPRLLAFDEQQASRHPAPGKWSPREVIGHLIDSASNNHERFVRAQFQDDLVFPGYDQDAWVRAQNYQAAPWRDLVGLWRHFNLQLARVMEGVPESIRMRERVRHNLHQLAWKALPEGAPATLDYFMRDYVGHLKHHLRQIEGLLAPKS